MRAFRIDDGVESSLATMGLVSDRDYNTAIYTYSTECRDVVLIHLHNLHRVATGRIKRW